MIDKSCDIVKGLRNPDRFDYYNELVPIMHKHPFIGPLLADARLGADLIEKLEAENKKLREALKEFIAEVRLGVRYGDHVIPQAITKVDEVLLQLLYVRKD